MIIVNEVLSWRKNFQHAGFLCTHACLNARVNEKSDSLVDGLTHATFG